jgi:hypothetical protein
MARVDYDRYPSEPAMVNELLKRVALGRQCSVLEPTAGSGQLAYALKQAGLQVMTNDIAYGSVRWKCKNCLKRPWTPVFEPDFEDWQFGKCNHCGELEPWLKERLDQEEYRTDYHYDAATDELWQKVARPDWVIGNPPFNQLVPILRRSLAHSHLGVAFILRLTALEPACTRSERGELLDEYADNLRYVMPFSGPRPSFTDDGKTDSVTTAWFVWMHGHSWRDFVGIQSPFQFIMNWKA